MPDTGGMCALILSRTAVCMVVSSNTLCAMVQQIWAMCMFPPSMHHGTSSTTPKLPHARRAHSCHSCTCFGHFRNNSSLNATGCGAPHHRGTAKLGPCYVQVLVQGHLLLPSDVTSDNIIGDNPPGINPDRNAATAYPVPTSHGFAVNMTVVTQNTKVGKVRHFKR